MVLPQRLLCRVLQKLEHTSEVLILHKDLALGKEVVDLVTIARHSNADGAIRASLIAVRRSFATSKGAPDVLNFIDDAWR